MICGLTTASTLKTFEFINLGVLMKLKLCIGPYTMVDQKDQAPRLFPHHPLKGGWQGNGCPGAMPSHAVTAER